MVSQYNITSHINDCEFTGMRVEMFYQYCTLKYMIDVDYFLFRF